MTILTIILLAILTLLALVLSDWFILTIITDIIKAHNIRKYKTWWGRLPMWATNLMSHFLY